MTAHSDYFSVLFELHHSTISLVHITFENSVLRNKKPNAQTL